MPFFHSASLLSESVITPAGQISTHLPHPTHFSSETTARTPLATAMAFFGQTPSQEPQATQTKPTLALFLDFAIKIPLNKLRYY
jgi:hypothetical protein